MMASKLRERGPRLDHRQRNDVIVGFAQIGRHVGYAAERHGAMRTPTAFAEWWKFCRRRKGASVFGCIDHRRDDAFGAEVERTADHGEIGKRHAHDRCRAALANSRDAGEDAGGVPQAMLAFDGDRGEAVTGQRFRDERIGQSAPAGEYCFAGVQTAGEAEAGNGHGERCSVEAGIVRSRCYFARISLLLACHDRLDGLGHQFGGVAADLVVGLIDALGVEILANLRQHIVVCCLRTPPSRPTAHSCPLPRRRDRVFRPPRDRAACCAARSP